MNCKENDELIPEISEIEAIGEGVCPVEWARECASIAAASNCGQSVMCRNGMRELLALISSLTTGEGGSEELTMLGELCYVIATTQGCELAAKTSKNVLFSIEKYRDDWQAHCRRQCPAMVCSAYWNLYIDPSLCTGCGACLQEGVEGGEGLIHMIRDDNKLKNPEFISLCPVGAIKKAGLVKPKLPEAPIPAGSFVTGGRRARRQARQQET